LKVKLIILSLLIVVAFGVAGRATRRTTHYPVDDRKYIIDSRLTIVGVPNSSTDEGYEGYAAFDSDYFYYCVDTDTWERVAFATWTGNHDFKFVNGDNFFTVSGEQFRTSEIN